MVGRFLDQSLDDKLRILDVNCRGPLILTHELGTAMAARRRGGILLMSSLAGFQGSPLVATYAATKAFNTVFAEGLWYELRREGVDVMACCAGATRTPAYEASKPAIGSKPNCSRAAATWLRLTARISNAVFGFTLAGSLNVRVG